MHHILPIVALLMGADPPAIEAGSLIRRLPKDGAWVSFHWTEDWDDGTKNSGKIVLKSVGAATVERVPCRWIELEFQPAGEQEPRPQNVAWKFLIPEKEFAADGDPLSHVKEAWKQVDGEGAQKLSLEYVNDVRVRLDLWLPPTISAWKSTDERRTIDWQQGRLDCSVMEADQRRKYRRSTLDVRCKLSLHDAVPFGVAASRLEMHDQVEGVDEAKGTMDLIILDMGQNAQSCVKNSP